MNEGIIKKQFGACDAASVTVFAHHIFADRITDRKNVFMHIEYFIFHILQIRPSTCFKIYIYLYLYRYLFHNKIVLYIIINVICLLCWLYLSVDRWIWCDIYLYELDWCWKQIWIRIICSHLKYHNNKHLICLIQQSVYFCNRKCRVFCRETCTNNVFELIKGQWCETRGLCHSFSAVNK